MLTFIDFIFHWVILVFKLFWESLISSFSSHLSIFIFLIFLRQNLIIIVSNLKTTPFIIWGITQYKFWSNLRNKFCQWGPCLILLLLLFFNYWNLKIIFTSLWSTWIIVIFIFVFLLVLFFYIFISVLINYSLRLKFHIYLLLILIPSFFYCQPTLTIDFYSWRILFYKIVIIIIIFCKIINFEIVLILLFVLRLIILEFSLEWHFKFKFIYLNLC